MSNTITRNNKKGKPTKYSKADSEKLNEFLNRGYGIEIDLTGRQNTVEQEAELKLAVPVTDRENEGPDKEDEGR